nr:TIGR03617 family F420-dependent LLM class oxidoreductase [Mycolicibacter sinensis]
MRSTHRSRREPRHRLRVTTPRAPPVRPRCRRRWSCLTVCTRLLAVWPKVPRSGQISRRTACGRSARRSAWVIRGAYALPVHVDVMTLPQHLGKAGELARNTQAAGFSGLLFTEAGRTAYLNAAIASQAAPDLELSTGVAVAFPRSPFVTAAAAWELQEATAGKFRLGLGTQVRTHVVRRYGATFDHPGPRLRDYVLAVKACFAAFRTGALDHHGPFYDLDFISAQWSPGAIDAPDPKVDIAAVNPWMLRMAGEVADGVHVHPLGEPGYLARHVVPKVAEGAGRAGRSASDIAIIVPAMTIVGDSDEERHQERELVRASLSFYGSTPNYAFIWDEAGFEGTTARIREKQKAGDFTGMAAQITDEHLAAFTTEATWDELGDRLIDKYGKVATRLVLYNALGDRERFERYGQIARGISGR